MNKMIAKGLFYLVAVILLVWTASLTYSFVASVLPNLHWTVPLFALVIFDWGMIAWLFVYLEFAEGSGQRAVALTLCIFDFIGVGLMVLSEIFLGGQTLVTPPENIGEYAIWGIGFWTVGNVAGVICFHLFHPEARQKITIRSEMDAVFDEALKKLKTKRTEVSGRLSDELSEGMLNQLMAELATTTGRDDLQRAQRSNGDQPVPLSESRQ